MAIYALDIVALGPVVAGRGAGDVPQGVELVLRRPVQVLMRAAVAEGAVLAQEVDVAHLDALHALLLALADRLDGVDALAELVPRDRRRLGRRRRGGDRRLRWGHGPCFRRPRRRCRGDGVACGARRCAGEVVCVGWGVSRRDLVLRIARRAVEVSGRHGHRLCSVCLIIRLLVYMDFRIAE